jgi:hypothetical protein
MKPFWVGGSLVAAVIMAAGYLHPVYAARSIQITADPTSVIGEMPITVTASLSGCTDGEMLIVKGAFQHDGSTNYFGYTQKDDGSWIKTGDTRDTHKQIGIGSWDGKMTVRPDLSDTGYLTFGEGEYLLKLGYYYKTSGGNWSSSVSWSNSIPITINEPDPTATPVPSPTRVPSSTPLPTPIPAATPVPTAIPSIVPTITQALSDDSDVIDDTVRGSILGTHSGMYADSLSSHASEIIMDQTSTESAIRSRSRTTGIGIAIVCLGSGIMLLAATVARYIRESNIG